MTSFAIHPQLSLLAAIKTALVTGTQKMHQGMAHLIDTCTDIAPDILLIRSSLVNALLVLI